MRNPHLRHVTMAQDILSVATALLVESWQGQIVASSLRGLECCVCSEHPIIQKVSESRFHVEKDLQYVALGSKGLDCFLCGCIGLGFRGESGASSFAV